MFREMLRGRFFRSDSKTIIVPLTAVVGGIFKWAIGYPKPVKASYAAGEVVRFDFAFTNTGDATADCNVTVTDTATGTVVCTYSWINQAPGVTYTALNQVIDYMPNKVWSLRCDITP